MNPDARPLIDDFWAGTATLAERQRLLARYLPIDDLLAREAETGRILPLSPDLIPALVLGATEFYARGWLAGRRQASPATHAKRFAVAAWRSLTD